MIVIPTHQEALVASIRVHHVDRLAAFKDNLLTVRRPLRVVIVPLVVGQIALIGAVSIDPVDVVILILIGSEQEILTIRRPSGKVAIEIIAGKTALIAT